jgi:hypothetical protein
MILNKYLPVYNFYLELNGIIQLIIQFIIPLISGIVVIISYLEYLLGPSLELFTYRRELKYAECEHFEDFTVLNSGKRATFITRRSIKDITDCSCIIDKYNNTFVWEIVTKDEKSIIGMPISADESKILLLKLYKEGFRKIFPDKECIEFIIEIKYYKRRFILGRKEVSAKSEPLKFYI